MACYAPFSDRGLIFSQVKLYEDFSRSKARRNIDSSVNSDEKEPQPKATGHIFQVNFLMDWLGVL